MDNSLIIQGRPIGRAELAQVRGLLAAHPDWSRYRLSRELCQVWNWRNHVGQIKDMAARSLLLKLEERGWRRLWNGAGSGAVVIGRPTGLARVRRKGAPARIAAMFCKRR